MTYSQRLDWHSNENRLTEATRRRRANGGEILDLTGSNPTQAGIVHDPAILAALSDPAALTYDPSAAGLQAAREAVALYEGADPDRVLLTASTSEAYAFLFKLLADPGDCVLTPRPSYPLFEHLARLEGIGVAQYPLRYHEGWWIDLESLAASAVRHSARAAIAVSPNNPTGSYLKREEMDAMRDLGLPVIVDEVFRDYSFHDDLARCIRPEGAFVLNGFSKLLGLPQMKLGWIVAPDAESYRRLEWIADTYLSVSAPVQHAAAKWLPLRAAFHARMMERLRENLAAAQGAMRVEGGWSAILRLPATRSEEDWTVDLLESQGVLVQPGYFYDFEHEPYIVLSLLTPPEVFREGLRRIWQQVN